MTDLLKAAVHTRAVSSGSDSEVVLGIDTHKDVHVAATVSTMGVLLGTRTFPATAAGYEQLLTWARTHGTVQRAGVECTSSYGAALTRHLHDHGIKVIEVNQPDRATRRRRGKTDAIDAEAAARAVLSGRATITAKTTNGAVEALRLFKLAKDSANKARTQAINQLKAVLVGADPSLREALSGLGPKTLFRRCAELPLPAATASITAKAVVHTLRLLAQRIHQLTAEIRDLERQLTETITATTPELLQRQGVGPDSAAALLIAAGDNPERMQHEAAYAALCGTSPVEASSGKTQRLRLNRGGDRQANAALYGIVITRLRWDQRTRDYLDRRLAEGKTRREAIRCLKRYVAREIFTMLQPAAA
ncbi:IS110 family RNA-guided transposase [Micromonospora radicis]|uniref:IS110 family transposase n=1 Tax=Micromonospora radicis TaxID=1894971 RepID=A0A418MQ27_9ACTN|nr:IS110 family transposase [Micromonospora radicis]RIV34589.1 IS110 family transposase [Micromonospora radicis]